jgi:hypothetical protein
MHRAVLSLYYQLSFGIDCIYMKPVSHLTSIAMILLILPATMLHAQDTYSLSLASN